MQDQFEKSLLWVYLPTLFQENLNITKRLVHTNKI